MDVRTGHSTYETDKVYMDMHRVGAGVKGDDGRTSAK